MLGPMQLPRWVGVLLCDRKFMLKLVIPALRLHVKSLFSLLQRTFNINLQLGAGQEGTRGFGEVMLEVRNNSVSLHYSQNSEGIYTQKSFLFRGQKREGIITHSFDIREISPQSNIRKCFLRQAARLKNFIIQISFLHPLNR